MGGYKLGSHRSDIILFVFIAALVLALAFAVSISTTKAAQRDGIILTAEEAQELQEKNEQLEQECRELKTDMSELRLDLDYLLQIISDQQAQIDSLTPEPWDLITPSLQAHTYARACQAGIPLEVLYALIWHESGAQEDAINHNTNGTVDIGLMQVNSVNWERFDEMGIDVHDPYGNVDAGVYLLWESRQKGYTPAQTLAAYTAGPAGMLDGGGMWFVEEIGEILHVGEEGLV